MKYIVVALLFLTTLTCAQLPSDLITHQPAPTAISLQNIAPSSAKAIDGLNPNLTKSQHWKMPDIGVFSSEPKTETQGREGVPSGLLNFSGAKAEIPANVGNVSKNATKLNKSTLIYL